LARYKASDTRSYSIMELNVIDLISQTPGINDTGKDGKSRLSPARLPLRQQMRLILHADAESFLVPLLSLKIAPYRYVSPPGETSASRRNLVRVGTIFQKRPNSDGMYAW
jgi:hypothetical protein